MQEEKIFLEFDKNDFIVRMTPLLSKDGKWTGELYMGTVTTEDNDLDDEDYANLLQVSSLVAASVPVMEEDIDVRNTLYNYVESVLAVDEEKETPLFEEEGNVIKINFSR